MDDISKKYLLKLFSVFFAFVLVATCTVLPVNADYQTEIILTASTAVSGGEAVIPVGIKNNSGIASLRFQLSYDADRLDFISANENSNFELGNLSALDNAENGLLNVIWFSVDGIKAEGDILYLKFKVTDTFIGKLSFSIKYRPEDILNDSLKEIPITVVTNDLTVYCRPADHRYDNSCDTDCNNCGEVREITHSYEWIVDKPATCGETGLKHEKCSVCSNVRSENTKINATGNHDFKWVIDEPATCGKDGKKHEECLVCGDISNANTKIAATGNHTYDDEYDADCNACTHIREVPTRPVQNGWVEQGGNWYFYENGAMVINAWRKDSIGWCYLLADGKMATNMWLRDSVGWCYVGTDGYCVTNKWVKDSKGWCYLNANGNMVINNWVKDGGKWYFLDANGYMVSNKWMKDSKGWVYLGSSGAMQTNAWCKDSVGWCYVGADGYCVTNKWVKDSKGWCYLNANGNMVVNNWVQSGGKWYFMDANGYMISNTSKYWNGKKYYFNASGVCTNP